MDPGTKPIAMSKEDWDKLCRKESSAIHLCLTDSVTTKCLWRRLCKEIVGNPEGKN